MGVPEGSCDPMESPRVSRFLAGPVIPRKEHTKIDFEELQPVGETRIGEGCEEALLWEGPNFGAEKEHEEEGAAQMKCYKLIQPPFHVPLCHFGREEGAEESGTKKVNLSPWRRRLG